MHMSEGDFIGLGKLGRIMKRTGSENQLHGRLALAEVIHAPHGPTGCLRR
jgi:hypothetical protein